MFWDIYFENYQAGLKGEDHRTGEFVKKAKKNAHNETQKFLDEYISNETKIKFIKYQKPMFPLEENRKNEIFQALKKIFPHLIIHDQYLRIQEDGENPGVFSYEILAKVIPSESPVWLELKELTESSYSKVYKIKKISNKERVAFFKNTLSAEDILSPLLVLNISGHEFSVRNKEQIALSFNIAEISSTEISNLVLDEAYALGQLHAQTLTKENIKIERYIEAWKTISTKEIMQSNQKIIELLQEIYKSKI